MRKVISNDNPWRYARMFFLVTAIVFTGCASTHHRPCRDSSPPAERERTLVRQLQLSIADKSQFRYFELGSWDDYAPRSRVQIVLRQNLTVDAECILGEVAAFAETREGVTHSEGSQLYAYQAIFALLDLLLWQEIALGRSTFAVRARLWSLWEGMYPVEMNWIHRQGLAHYESEVLRSRVSLCGS